MHFNKKMTKAMLLNIKSFLRIFHLPFVTNFWFCKKLHRISSAKFHSAYQATWKMPGAVLKRGRVRSPAYGNGYLLPWT